ncbi:MAG: tripartite tricarboxylate transporter substrate binding protein [Xanthobacteraceae bacterium]
MANRIALIRAATSALVAAGLAVSLPMLAAAQDYPTRPITLIVPYPPGGGVDLVGRLVGQKLSAALGQQVVVENRGGAGGMIGTRDIAHAKPDGYTLGIMLTGISLSPNAGYDVNKDFSPIGLIASTPIFVVANPSLPAKSLADIVTLAKKRPGKIAIGTPPSPTLNYFATKLFDLVAGVDTITVTYRGTAPLTTDVIGNHVPLGFDTIPAAISNVQSGQLRAIAVTGAQRSAALPDVPTAAESGLPGFDAVQYYGVTAPAGVPRAIVERLNKELRTMLADAAFKKRLIEAGDDPAPGTPEQYAENIKREEGKWAALIKKLGLKVE